MMHGTPSRQPVVGNGRDRLEDLLELIDALIAVVSEENAALAKGHPASQSRYTKLKVGLGDQFEQWVKDVSMRNSPVVLAEPGSAGAGAAADRLPVHLDGRKHGPLACGDRSEPAPDRRGHGRDPRADRGCLALQRKRPRQRPLRLLRKEHADLKRPELNLRA